MTTAAVYLRVSTRHQAEDGFSLEDQRGTLTALAATRGWDHTVYEDAGLSGESIEGRPGMVSLLAALDRGDHHAVLVMDESRLARNDLTAAIIRDRLQRAQVTLVTPSGDRNFADAAGVLVSTILGANASFEQTQRTEKITAGLRNAARAGFWPGGPAPYGYALSPDPGGTRHTVLSINETEATTLREAASLILDHAGTTWTVARTLNATNRLTRSNRPWQYRNLARLLQKPHLTGTYTYDSDQGPIPMEIPAILEQGRWDALQAILRAPQTPERKNKFYALSGFLRCACGGSLSGIWRKDRILRFYQCSRTASFYPKADRCPHRPRYLLADDLETTIWNEIHSVLTSPDRLRQAAQRNITVSLADAPLRATQKAKISHRLDQLDLEETGVIRTRGRDEINQKQLAEALEQIRDERVTLKGNLAQLDAWDTERRASRARLSQLDHLARQATKNLSNTTPQDQRRVYELLGLQIDVTPQRTYEISGTIPTHGPLTEESLGEVSTQVLQHPCQDFTTSGVPFGLTLEPQGSA